MENEEQIQSLLRWNQTHKFEKSLSHDGVCALRKYLRKKIEKSKARLDIPFKMAEMTRGRETVKTLISSMKKSIFSAMKD